MRRSCRPFCHAHQGERAGGWIRGGADDRRDGPAQHDLHARHRPERKGDRESGGARRHADARGNGPRDPRTHRGQAGRGGWETPHFNRAARTALGHNQGSIGGVIDADVAVVHPANPGTYTSAPRKTVAAIANAHAAAYRMTGKASLAERRIHPATAGDAAMAGLEIEVLMGR